MNLHSVSLMVSSLSKIHNPLLERMHFFSATKTMKRYQGRKDSQGNEAFSPLAVTLSLRQLQEFQSQPLNMFDVHDQGESVSVAGITHEQRFDLICGMAARGIRRELVDAGGGRGGVKPESESSSSDSLRVPPPPQEVPDSCSQLECWMAPISRSLCTHL